MVGHSLVAFGQAGNSWHMGQLLAVIGINFGPALHDMGHVFQLQQAKSGVDFTHFGVDAWGDNGDLVHKAKVFQVINALFGFGIVADDGAAFKGVEDFGGVKAQYR